MLSKLILLLVALASLTVIPSPNRPRTKRLSRGPAWTDFRKLAVDPARIEAVKEENKERTRIAVVARQTGQADDPSDADIAAELIRSAMRYSHELIVMDAATTESLFHDNQVASIRSGLQAGHVDVLVMVTVSAHPNTLSLEFIRSDPEQSTHLGPINLPASDNPVIDASIRSRAKVLEELGAEVGVNAAQLGRTPHATSVSLKQYIKARRKLRTVVKIDDEQERKNRCKDALKFADLAIDNSPRFLDAYLVKASCHDELDETVELQQTLKIAYKQIDPPEHDELTLLELKGDYARFVLNDVDEQYARYVEILEIDPTNLTGLWTMIDILLTSPDAAKDKETLEFAARYAAQLIAFHPDSAVARAIRDKGGAE